MTTFTGTRTTTYVEIQCGECGVPFAMSETFYKERQCDKRTWYCPAGHGRVYHESTEDRLRREIDEAYRHAGRIHDELARERKSHSVTKGKVTKLRKRAEAGMCSECGRTFANYARHQADVHGVENGFKHR